MLEKLTMYKLIKSGTPTFRFYLQTERNLTDVHHVKVLQYPKFFLHVCVFIIGHASGW